MMIYTLTRDDMPSLSAWIKKHSFKRTSVFCHSCPKKNWEKPRIFYTNHIYQSYHIYQNIRYYSCVDAVETTKKHRDWNMYRSKHRDRFQDIQ